MIRSNASRPGVVLLVDDDAFFVQLLDTWLKRHRYLSISCGNGLEALNFLRLNRMVRVIVLDLHMPVLDGFQFLAEREQDPALRAVPVVVLTGISFDRKKLAPYRVDHVLAKPVASEALLRTLEPYWPAQKTDSTP
jgi:CheY-like chemotaxis protein